VNNQLINLPVYVTIFICLVCGISDLRTRKIPNIVTFPAILVGLILNTLLSFILGFGLQGLFSSLLGFTIGFGFFFFFYWMSKGTKMGAGDVKLFGAIGALLGYKLTIYALVSTAIAGLVVAVILFFPVFYLLLRSANLSVLTSFKNKPVPYGVSIACGTILVCLLKVFHILDLGLYF
jgi:prepilin peptidase CpaA